MNKTELLNEAKKAKSLEELTQMAADVGIPLTEEEAKFYFSLVNQQEGELSMEELDAATGGGGSCEIADGKTSLANCKNWQCEKCGNYAPGQYSCLCNPLLPTRRECGFCMNRNSVQQHAKCSLYVDDGSGC